MKRQTCTLDVFTYDALRGAGAEGRSLDSGVLPSGRSVRTTQALPLPQAYHCWHSPCSQLSPRVWRRALCRHRGGHGG